MLPFGQNVQAEEQALEQNLRAVIRVADEEHLAPPLAMRRAIYSGAYTVLTASTLLGWQVKASPNSRGVWVCGVRVLDATISNTVVTRMNFGTPSMFTVGTDSANVQVDQMGTEDVSADTVVAAGTGVGTARQFDVDPDDGDHINPNALTFASCPIFIRPGEFWEYAIVDSATSIGKGYVILQEIP